MRLILVIIFLDEYIKSYVDQFIAYTAGIGFIVVFWTSN